MGWDGMLRRERFGEWGGCEDVGLTTMALAYGGTRVGDETDPARLEEEERRGGKMMVAEVE